MDDIMLCPSCGNKLPKESSFCPYCMTKFTPEAQIDNKPKKSSKPVKIIIAAAVVTVVAAVAVAVLFAPDKASQPNSTSPPESASQTGTTSVRENGSDALPPAVPELHDSAFGFMSGGSDDEASLFYKSSFVTASHSSLVASESAYKGAKIKFDCVVLKADGDIAFVEYGATRGFDGIYNSTSDYAAVKMSGVSAGDSLTVYGTFIGVENYVIGGKNESLPTFELFSCTDFVYYGVPSPVFSEEDISAAARRIFGDSITVKKSVRSDFSDPVIADILVDGGLYYTAVTEHGNYCIYAGENSFIMDCTSTAEKEKYVLPAVNTDNIYTYTFDNETKKFTLACLDKSFSTLWTREFKNSLDAVFDYTSDCFYVIADSNLYVLDVSTGENAVSPKYVGSRCGILKVEDGLILISDKNTDTVSKTDMSGNIIWSTSLSGDISDSYAKAQTLASGYLVSFENYTALVTDEGKVAFEYSEN